MISHYAWRLAGFALVVVLASGILLERSPSPAEHGSAPSHVLGEGVVIRPIRPVELTAGWTADALVEIQIQEGHHVQAHTVPFAYLIPTQLEFVEPEVVHLGLPVYPPGKPLRLHNSANTLSVYDGTVAITIPLHAPMGAQSGRYVVHGVLRYQHCDTRQCFRPTSLPITLPVTILGPA